MARRGLISRCSSGSTIGYDEAWIGEHHSAGWEIIVSPELVIAAAAERTKHIMLGTGVTSLPYHQPFFVAQRFVQLCHTTRGRAMMGCGPGALVSDAYQLGIEPATRRNRMDEALDAIMALLRCEEPVSMTRHADPLWPGLRRQARAGKCCRSVRDCQADPRRWPGRQWDILEETAIKHGKVADRRNWRLVVTVHVAEDTDRPCAKSMTESGWRPRLISSTHSPVRTSARPFVPRRIPSAWVVQLLPAGNTCSTAALQTVQCGYAVESHRRRAGKPQRGCQAISKCDSPGPAPPPT